MTKKDAKKASPTVTIYVGGKKKVVFKADHVKIQKDAKATTEDK